MKLTKSGEIEACCEWAKTRAQSQRIFSDKILGKKRRIIGMMTVRLTDIKALGGEQLNFCPNCGSKTEIEGE